MTPLSIWITIAGMALLTLATRTIMLAFGDRIPLPERVRHALRYAPACALAALIAPELLTDQGAWAISVGNPKFVAGALAIVVMLASRSMMATMALGMAAFLALRLLA